MKKNYISELRYSQKIKQSQSFKQADGLQKKVRKGIKIIQQFNFDAEKQMRKIMCFWKDGWDYEHSHSVFLNPKVYYPIVTVSDPAQQTNQQLIRYAQMIRKLIERLRVDQQNEVNYKLQERKYIHNWSQMKTTDQKWKYHKVAELSNQHLLKNLNLSTKAMLQSVQNSLEEIDRIDYCLDSDQIHKVSEIKKELMFINRIIDRHLYSSTNENQMQQENTQPFIKETQNLNTFVANVISVLDQMKKQYHGPSFFSVQPQIGEITYILHPILWSIMSLFQKEKIQIQKVNKFKRLFQESIPYKENQSKDLHQLDQIQRTEILKESQIWRDQHVSSEPYLIGIKDNFKRQNERYSKVLFLNLDGYESEYNLQVARNFSQNLMYISFPKFSSTSKKQTSAYEERFYNKIMFEKTKLGETSSQNQQLNYLLKQQRFMKSPEEYHQNVEKLYKENHLEINHNDFLKKIDRNQNLFVFPIRMNCLFEKHQEEFPHSYHTRSSKTSPMEQDETSNRMLSEELQSLGEVAEHYESHFIRFMMKRYLYSQITKFKPTHVIISYSNRIILQDSHFIELIQELTNIGRYKIMLFPNFTTSYINEIKMEVKEEEVQSQEKNQDEEISNCYAFTNSRLVLSQSENFIDSSLITKEFDQCPLTLSFFSKLIRFLKITSGTYNLQQSFENQSLSAKLKNVKIFPYAEFLFNILTQEYPQMKNKIDRQILKSDKVFLEDRFEEEKEDLRKCVPRFYRDLFKMLETLVIHGVHGNDSLEGKEFDENGNQIFPSPYTLDVRRVFEYLMKIGDKQGIKRIRNYQMESIKKSFNEFIESQEKEKMDSRYQKKNHLYFKIRSQNDQYKKLINQATLNLKSNNSGLRIVTFKIGKQRILHIYKDTSIVFETNQLNKPETFILVMNHLGLDSQQVSHYIGKINLTTDKQSLSRETCQVQPIKFYDGQYELQRQKFKALCEWNYTETSQFLILYWPSEYDFVKASLFKMIKQQYEPRICHDIFIARKNDFTKFYRAKIVLDKSAASILPRRGCSAYVFQEKIFIFGGVYEREFNYLSLQHDIVTFDIQQLNSLQNYQLALENQKKQLFSSEHLNNVIKNCSKQIKLNSFIRPKLQIEFFDIQDICPIELKQNDKIKTVVMIGGYGENFMFPHSLITYFYHLIKFNKQTKKIISIQKRNTIEKPIPINLKELIKNKHIFQQFHIYQNKAFSQGLTHQDHYFFHRAIYNLQPKNIQKQNLNEPEIYELNFKFLFMYATELFNKMDKNFLRFAQKTGERRVIEESEGIKVEIVNGCNNNLFITNQDGTFLYSLNYKSEITSLQSFSLTHEAIISLDVNSNIVCALLKHKQHTKDKCIIASEKISLSNPKFAFQNQNHYINLIKFIELQETFDLHVLLMMKRNQMIIVHGVSFSQYQVNDKIISTRYTKGENLGEIVPERSPEVVTPCVSLETYFDCTSFIERQNQKILTINLMSHCSKQQQFIYACEKYSLDMNNQNKQWKCEFTKQKLLSFFTTDGSKQIYLGKVRFIQMRQSLKNKLSNSICVICPSTPLYLSSRQFYFSLEKIDNEQKILYKQKEVIKVRVSQLTEKEIWSRVSWKRIYKNQQRYQDSGIKFRNNQL